MKQVKLTLLMTEQHRDAGLEIFRRLLDSRSWNRRAHPTEVEFVRTMNRTLERTRQDQLRLKEEAA